MVKIAGDNNKKSDNRIYCGKGSAYVEMFKDGEWVERKNANMVDGK